MPDFLRGDQPGVSARPVEEHIVAALLDEAAAFQDHDPVGVADGGEPMRNQDRRPPEP